MDWYRRKTWTETDESEFFAKLGRASKFGRVQYLRVQAVELIETKEPYLLNVAEKLLNKLLNDYQDNVSEKSLVFYSLGNIYKIQENFNKAMEYFKIAIEFEKTHICAITQSSLDFSELVIKLEKIEQYEFVEQLIEKKVATFTFPIEKYLGYSFLSIIYKYKGEIQKAKHFENLGNENANASTSGLRYHKYLGVVNERDNLLDELVRRK